MKNIEIYIPALCQELGGITKQTLYRYVSPDGKLRKYGEEVLKASVELRRVRLDDMIKKPLYPSLAWFSCATFDMFEKIE